MQERGARATRTKLTPWMTHPLVSPSFVLIQTSSVTLNWPCHLDAVFHRRTLAGKFLFNQLMTALLTPVHPATFTLSNPGPMYFFSTSRLRSVILVQPAREMTSESMGLSRASFAPAEVELHQLGAPPRDQCRAAVVHAAAPSQDQALQASLALPGYGPTRSCCRLGCTLSAILFVAQEATDATVRDGVHAREAHV
ncbi:hypothetical protein B296_00007169 [Ensete ventricosum]|uniref:Uncharacterized protein n=1 Tax=Ensete ventricosum TaxID=4639 RepID=A0A426YLE6_ENSVE|nr:hypothetical protein B296_00007169 [Ensete ventricosum]